MESFSHRVQQVISECESLHLIADTVSTYETVNLSELHLGNNGIRGVMQTAIMALEVLHGSGIGHGGIGVGCFVKGTDCRIRVTPPTKTDTSPQEDTHRLGMLLSELLKKSDQRPSKSVHSKPPRAAFDLAEELLSDTPPELHTLLGANEWLMFPPSAAGCCHHNRQQAALATELKSVTHEVANLQAQLHQVIAPTRTAAAPPPVVVEEVPFGQSVMQIVESLGAVVDDAVFNISQRSRSDAPERSGSDTRDRYQHKRDTDTTRIMTPPVVTPPAVSTPVFEFSTSERDTTLPQPLPGGGSYSKRVSGGGDGGMPSDTTVTVPPPPAKVSVPMFESAPLRAESPPTNPTDGRPYSPLSAHQKGRRIPTHDDHHLSLSLSYSPLSAHRQQLDETLPGDAFGDSFNQFPPATASITSFLRNEERLAQMVRKFSQTECSLNSDDLTNQTDTTVVARQHPPTPYSGGDNVSTCDHQMSAAVSVLDIKSSGPSPQPSHPWSEGGVKCPPAPTPTPPVPNPIDRNDIEGRPPHLESAAVHPPTARATSREPSPVGVSTHTAQDDVLQQVVATAAEVIPCIDISVPSGGRPKGSFITLKHSHSSREVIERSVSESLLSVAQRGSSPVMGERATSSVEATPTTPTTTTATTTTTKEQTPRESEVSSPPRIHQNDERGRDTSPVSDERVPVLTEETKGDHPSCEEGLSTLTPKIDGREHRVPVADDPPPSPSRKMSTDSLSVDVQIQCCKHNHQIEICNSPIGELRSNARLSVSNMSCQCSLDMEPERLQFEETHQLTTSLLRDTLQNKVSGNLQLAHSLQEHLKRLILKNDKLRSDLKTIQHDLDE